MIRKKLFYIGRMLECENMLANPKNLKILEEDFLDNLRTVFKSQGLRRELWKVFRKAYIRLDKNFQFFNTNRILYMISLYEYAVTLSKVQNKRINGCSRGIFYLALYLRYMRFSPRRADNITPALKSLKKFLIKHRWDIKEIDALILKLTGVLVGSYTNAYFLLRDIDNYYYCEHCIAYDQFRTEIEFDYTFNGRRTLKQYYEYRTYILKGMLRRRKFFDVLGVGKFHQDRARQNMKAELERCETELNLYGLTNKERRLARSVL